jgi:hypothetical protein
MANTYTQIHIQTVFAVILNGHCGAEYRNEIKSGNPRASAVQTANDILKAHDGFLEVSTKQSEGTCPIIKLSKSG